MAVHMVSYDLIKRKDYQELFAALGSYSPSWHCLGSTWIIKTNKTATQVRDHLIQHIDSDDRLIVTALTGEAAWTTSFSKECQDWLRTNLS
jgi:hypothetical protein